MVTVGQVGGPEDSFFVDLDGDGFIDVESNCDGIAMQVDNKHGIDFVAGCKDGYISWFESP